MDKYIKKWPNARNRVVSVPTVLPGSTAESVIHPGDILWEVEGKQINADLTVLDHAMNEATKSKIKLTVIRNGKKLEKEVKIYDLEKNKISQMFDFAGGIFLRLMISLQQRQEFLLVA